MPRKATKRSPSQEAVHQADLKRRKSEYDKNRRSKMSDQGKQAENKGKRNRMQDLRSNLSEVEKALENENDRDRMQNLRSNLSEVEKALENENDRDRMQNLRSNLSEVEKALENENDRDRMQNLRSNLSEVEKALENENDRDRMQNLRSNLSEVEKALENENARDRMQNLRSNLSEVEKALENENARDRMQNLRSNLSEVEKALENENACDRMQNRRSTLSEGEINERNQQNRTSMRNKRRPKHQLTAGGKEVDDNTQQHYLGPMNLQCTHCGSKHFESEKVSNKGLSFSLCCQHGSSLSLNAELPYPEELKKLFDIKEFREKIRPYNSAHAFASFNANIVNFGINRPGPYSFVVQGQVYNQINTALRNAENENKSYGQLYFTDPLEAVETRLQTFSQLNSEITKILSVTLSRINCHAQAFKMMYEQYETQQTLATQNGTPPLNLSMHFSLKKGVDPRRFNLQTSNEVAAVFATTDDGEVPDSYVTIYDKEGRHLKTVNALDKNVEPWLYPIFFPHGQPIWHHEMKKLFSKKNEGLTRGAYAKFKISIREGEFNAVLHGGRLFQQWLVDTALKIIKERVEYLRKNQNKIYRDSYANIDSFMKKHQIDNNASSIGTKIILPSTHTGSPRYMEQVYQDAMAIVRRLGKPDLFVTMTCNPNWPEIVENLFPGQTPADRPDLVARVFKQKLNFVVDLIEKKGYFGECKAYVYTIEFQKRGLPHAHLLVTLEGDYKLRTAEVIDRYISALLPDPEKFPNLFNLVSTHMTHGPCGFRCEKDGKCSKGFPKNFQDATTLDEDAYPTYARPNNDRSVTKSSGFVVDNQYVVPHCPNLLLLMNCHINVEVVSSIKAVKYLYKYIFKGHDAAAIKIVDGVVQYDECESFLNSRYMGAAEAAWRIFKFELHGKSHSITRLPLHLPNEQSVNFIDAENIDGIQAALDKKTMLMDYFELNIRDPKARNYFYGEIPEHFTWAKNTNTKKFQWNTRKGAFNNIGRMYTVSPTNQELFHLRILLNHVKGATSYDELKTVDGKLCQTFTEACLELGLVEDDKEWYRVLAEARISLLPYQMRSLFVRLLIHCSPLAPQDLWEEFKEDMSEDFAITMSMEIAIQKAYREVIGLLENEDKTLADFPTMNQNINFDEDYDAYDPLFDQAIGEQMYDTMNEKQKEIVNKVLNASENMNENSQKLYYLDGPGGSGKTYLYKTLWHLLRVKGKKVQTMAFTGIAAILLPGGKTIHKTIGLPVPLYSDSNSILTPKTKQAENLKNTDVFICDETPMAPRYALEIMDRTLRDFTKIDEPFGGKIVILGGDFRQLLPVRKNGTRSECVNLSIKFSDLWKNFEQFKLHQNMRADAEETEFAEYLLKIGEGIINDENDNFEIPTDFIIENNLVEEVYGTLIRQNRFNDVSNSAILSARNADVDELNNEVVSMLPVEGEKIYSSIDSAIEGEALQELLTQEYLNSLNPPSLPPHELRLRKNTVIMLIRNLSQAEGLCNGTRLLVIGLMNNTLQCKILTGDKKGEIVMIHRILLYNEENYPFTLARRQFPIKIAFAMTINKSQGQTFEIVGIDLRKDVFNHGQMYVACSRVKRWSALKIYLGQQRLDKKVKNYVYKEIIN